MLYKTETTGIRMALLDEYERKARLGPGLLAVLPIAVSATTLGYKQYPAVAVLVGFVTTGGGTYLLAQLVAHSGRRVQASLWQRWGGRPTTQLLRFHNCATNPTQRDIWRAALQRLTGVALLSQRREAANPQAADEAIEAASDQARRLGQDVRFPLVAAENVQYGFERNLYGFRWIGRWIAIACTAALIVIWRTHAYEVSQDALIVGLVIDCVWVLIWEVVPSETRARAAAFRYAQQLMQAVVHAVRHGSQPVREEGVD